MERRAFLASVILPMTEVFNSKELRKVEVWNGKKWTQVRMREIRQGDLFRLNDLPGEFTAAGDAFLYENDLWSVHVETKCLVSAT